MPTDIRPATAPLAVTMGEPAGIGPDVVLLAHARSAPGKLPPFVAIADPDLMKARAGALGLADHVSVIADIEAACGLPSAALPVLPVALSIPAVCGHPDARNAAAVIASIEIATKLVTASRASAIVTSPIAKRTLYDAGFRHPGHTEFLGWLAQQSTGRPAHPVMMLVSDTLRVVPVTVHVALRDVPALLTIARIVEVAEIAARALATDFGIDSPKLVVAGLNPHAGEGGTIGREDEEIVRPAIERLQRQGLSISGPHSADTLFHAAARARYDCVIAMYHDQALIPLKTLAFDSGVNVTLGLPFVRTSPDHGTAFDIAGTGRASPESFIAALKLADAIAQSRARHK